MNMNMNMSPTKPENSLMPSLKKMKWKINLSNNYSKYSWIAKNEDDTLKLISEEFQSKQLSLDNWKEFAKVNHIKYWVITNKN